MLHLLLPYAMEWPEILHGMLSLSTTPSERSSLELGHHQAALLALQQETGRLQHGVTDMVRVLKTLSCSFLLAIFGIGECDGCWAQHVRGMVSIIRMADWNALTLSKVGLFLLSACAHQDISAFSMGNTRRSHRAWLAWMVHRRSNNDGTFSPFETLIGYPESLITIIAFISEAAEDARINELQKRSSHLQEAASSIGPSSPHKYILGPFSNLRR